MPRKRVRGLTSTVVISRSQSYCSNCNRNVVDFKDNKKWHRDESGWASRKNGGCGATFTAKSTDQIGQGAEYVAHLWPKLPFIPYHQVDWKNS